MGVITYNTTLTTLNYIFRATSGGTVFSTNQKDLTSFDYFDDTAVVNDALYIGAVSDQAFSDVAFNIGTALAGTGITVIWERMTRTGGVWEPITNMQDDTNGFTTTGIKKFKFGLKHYWYKTTINTFSAFWIRARISTLTSITEGGANTTNVVTLADSKVNIDGYTDGSPCTPELVYQYLLTNAPWVGVTKTSFHYDFTAVSLYMNSRFKVSNCGIEFGMGSSNPGRYSVDYLQMGDKVDEYFGTNGGWLIIKATTNSYPFHFTINCKLYGSKVIAPNEYAGYPVWLGEWIDCDIDGINVTPVNGGSIKNCRIVNPGTWIANGFPPVFERNRVLMRGTYFAYFYAAGVNIADLSWAFNASSGRRFLYFYQTSNNPEFVFTDPVPALPGATTPNSIMHRDVNSFLTYDKVWFYDNSAATYTDYTTEYSNATPDNAPISGDVGDIYYLGYSSNTRIAFNTALKVTTNLLSNDYEYRFEYYMSGLWRVHDVITDLSNNFTISDKEMYLAKQAVPGSQSLLSVNGFSGYWTRIVITKKGTGDKYITNMTASTQTGCGNWSIKEKFTAIFNIRNIQKLPIENAKLTISLDGVEIYSGLSDVNGNTIKQSLISRNWYFDPVNSYDNYRQIGENVNSAYLIKVEADGYEYYEEYILMTEKINKEITLKAVNKLRKDLEGNNYFALNADTGSSSKIFKI